MSGRDFLSGILFSPGCAKLRKTNTSSKQILILRLFDWVLPGDRSILGRSVAGTSISGAWSTQTALLLARLDLGSALEGLAGTGEASSFSRIFLIHVIFVGLIQIYLQTSILRHALLSVHLLAGDKDFVIFKLGQLLLALASMSGRAF